MLLGTIADWSYNGKDYKVCKRDLLIESQFCDWVMREAALSLARLKPYVPPEFYEAQMRHYSTKVAGKRFRWDSEEVNSALWSEEGKRHMIWLKIMRGQEKGGATLRREEIDALAANTNTDENGLTKWNELEDILYQQDHPDFFLEYVKPVREAVKTQASPTNGYQIRAPEGESPLPSTSVLSS